MNAERAEGKCLHLQYCIKKNLFTDAVQYKILAAGGLKHSSFTAGLRNPNQAVKLQRASGFLSVKLRYLNSGT